jgi:hypothetical protein
MNHSEEEPLLEWSVVNLLYSRRNMRTTGDVRVENEVTTTKNLVGLNLPNNRPAHLN